MVLSVAILVVLIGTTLVASGVRGRRFADDAPRCRRCGYDLRATTAERCPECGASLAGRRAIRRGRVWRRPGWIAAGVMIVAIGGATIGVDRGGLLNPEALDRLAPTAWLLWRVDHERGQSLSEAVDRMILRLAVEPARVSDAQRRSLLVRLAALHADPAGPWQPRWCDPIERAFVDGVLPPELLPAYLDPLADSLCLTLPRPTLAPREPIRPTFAWSGTPRVRLGQQARFFGSQPAPLWGIDCRFIMRLGGVVISDQRESRTPDGFLIRRPDDPVDWTPNWGYVPRVPGAILATLAPGPQVLEVELLLDFEDTSRHERGTLYRAVRTFEIPVTLLAASTRPID